MNIQRLSPRSCRVSISATNMEIKTQGWNLCDDGTDQGPLASRLFTGPCYPTSELSVSLFMHPAWL